VPLPLRLTRLDEEFRPDMAFFGDLRVFESLPGAFEIGAGMLQPGIEKPSVEGNVEIILMGCVAPCQQRSVGTAAPACRAAPFFQKPEPARAVRPSQIDGSERQRVEKYNFCHFDVAVDVELSALKFRVRDALENGAQIIETQTKLTF
jgi:hypothetical protein